MKEFKENYPYLDVNEIIKGVRYYIYRYFIENSKAPVLEDIMIIFNRTKSEIIKILNELEELHHLKLVPGVSRILMAWPFSNIPTQYIISTESGKNYYANCAWDSIAFHIILNQSIKITAFCYHCDHSINISVSNNKIIKENPTTTIINFSKPIAQWMDNVIDTCGNTMNFFASQQHLNEWQEQNPNVPNYSFTDRQILAISKLIYTKRAEFDYERPTTEKMTEFLKGEELTGEFWSVDEYH
jgi:hypothetical protein